jgi:gluconolactonase
MWQTRFFLVLVMVLASQAPSMAGNEASTIVPAEFHAMNPRFHRLVPAQAHVEKIADGFTWVEGPVWDRTSGSLLFSDIPANAIYRWTDKEGVSLFLKNSGYSGLAPFPGKEPGSNGLTFDGNGRLVLCRHGDRQIGRLEPDGHMTPLAERYDGHRLNSPNDLVYTSNGDLYFTDPPFGLPQGFDDPAKAPVQGVYRLTQDGALTLLIADLKAPNGIAFSPDEQTLYVSDVDPQRSAWLAYDVTPEGGVTNGRVFFDAMRWRRDPFFGPDGFKVDEQGNLFGTRPGGLSIIAADGTLLGTIEWGVLTSNVAWGEDGRTLFVTAGSAVYRLKLTTRGAGY